MQTRDLLHNLSRVRVGRIGMGCKADFAVNSTAIEKKFNAADRPRPGYHGPREVMQRVPRLFIIVARFKIGQQQLLQSSVIVGSEGKLGIISAATLKLSPMPAARLTAWAAVASMQHALTLRCDPTISRQQAGFFLPRFCHTHERTLRFPRILLTFMKL